MWKRNEVDESQQYQVALCQRQDGLRYFSLYPLDGPIPPSTVLVTEVVPIDLILRGNFRAITSKVKLTSGESFYVDAHNTWLTGPEWDAMDQDLPDVPWLNGIAPLFAPK